MKPSSNVSAQPEGIGGVFWDAADPKCIEVLLQQNNLLSDSPFVVLMNLS